ncbi:MAG: PLP-dependent aspartate aminotransferase family protein [Planctomycetota bacterium]|jgi:cystathionine beta-lyase|nr:PLP-dependent aspartate aminotransferase family protein [Planctomycetota bacterium]
MDYHTLLVHAGWDRDPVTGASSIPVYHASTFDQDDPDQPGEYDYSRSGNPTRAALEKALAELEGGAAAFAFASGMAAVSAALMLFQPGDHLIVGLDVYGGTFRALTRVFRRWGLTASFVDTGDPANIRAALTPATRGIWIETPSNPLLRITDLAAVAELAREHGLLAIADGTFATPFLQRPLDFGFDLVVHSATKFLNGHSDVLAGIAAARTEELGRRVKFVQNALGAVLGVQDCWLLLRGLKTLGVRLAREQATAGWLAERLEELPEVTRVYYPLLAGHPGREIHLRQAAGGGAVLSFELAGGEAARAFLKRLRLPLLAVSLGGVESIMTYPVTMSHASMPREERERRGISDRLVRLSVGLEAGEDLLADIKRALRPEGR